MNEEMLTPLRVLTDLVHTCRWRANVARYWNQHNLVHAYESAGRTLDATRTRLVQEGEDYLSAAWSFIDAGRMQVAILAQAEVAA